MIRKKVKLFIYHLLEICLLVFCDLVILHNLVDILVLDNLVEFDLFVFEVVDENGKSDKLTLPKVGTDFDYASLHKKLVIAKQQHPKIFRLDLSPNEKIDYKSIVKKKKITPYFRWLRGF